MQPSTIAFSLTRGGPLFRLMRKLHLAQLDPHDVLRQTLAIAALCWVPLQLFIFVDPTSDPSRASTWSWLALHTRFLIATPLLLAAEQFAELRCERAIDSVARPEFGIACARKVAEYARAAERMRDSTFAELALLGLMIAIRIVIWRSTGHAALITDYNATGNSDVAAVWHGFVSLPVFNFLLLRWFWRWLIWSILLFRISRLPLRLAPPHPDYSGGLGRLAEPSYAVAILACGLSAFLAASWGTEIVRGRAELSTFTLKIAALVAGAELLAVAPVVPFAGALSRARFEGGDEYSGFALAYIRLFQKRWIADDQREGLLGTPDISGLADLIASVDRVAKLRILPLGRAQLLGVLVGVLAPLSPLPLLAADASIPDLLQHLLKVVLFGS